MVSIVMFHSMPGVLVYIWAWECLRGMSVLSSDGMCCSTSILGIATPPENRS